MNARDPVFGERDRPAGVRTRTSAFVGSRISHQGIELDVVEIGPFPLAAGEAPARFRARLAGGGALAAGSLIDTRWGVCEVVV